MVTTIEDVLERHSEKKVETTIKVDEHQVLLTEAVETILLVVVIVGAVAIWTGIKFWNALACLIFAASFKTVRLPLVH